MVKADLTRDYYADLELPPNADAAEIKKQFKKLAFKHHPDRNPGREVEVTADFQRIQSAHEVLIDVQERAKYDAQRIRPGNGFRNSYAGHSGGTSSGMKGNPWSGVSSQFPTPPKPPTRQRPSAGAQRYTNNFKPPTQSAYQAAQNEPSSRQDTYNAFDRMHHRPKPEQQPGSGNTWQAPKPPPRGTPQSGRDASNAQARAQAERAEADRVQAEQAQSERARSNARSSGYDEYRESNSSQPRSQSSNASNRKKFQPNTPGGDEPPAPRGAYFTARDKPMAPPPPPRQPPTAFTANIIPDPLESFRRKEVPSMETRSSQPYNTHGGEKFSLFDSPNISRSKSTREGSGRFDDGQVPRTGSDSNLNTPHRTKSSAQRSPRPARVDSSSSDDLPEMSSSKAGPSANKSNDSAPRTAQQAPDTAKRAESYRKQGKLSKMRQWMEENPGQKPPPDGFPPDGPPLRFTQETPIPNSATGANGQPSMYADFAHNFLNSKNACSISFLAMNPPSVPRNVSQSDDISQRERWKYFPPRAKFATQQVELPARYPSGLADGQQILNAFEKEQQAIIDMLLSTKRMSSYSQKPLVKSGGVSGDNSAQPDKSSTYRVATEPELASTKARQQGSSLPCFNKSHAYGEQVETLKNDANYVAPTRFSFPVNNDTFTPTQTRTNGFSSSAENISTKFTPEDWDGKFEAGADYFKPAESVSSTNPRAQSANRSRGRSPPKARPVIDPRFMPTGDSDIPIESPGGTKFSAEQWSETFKPQTFMPPSNHNAPPRQQSGRKRTGTNIRPTMGGRAAVVDESDTSDEKPLFPDRRTSSPQASMPDPMDVDTPPAARTVPQFIPSDINQKLKVNPDPLKRPVAVSTPPPVDQEDLTVNFEDLKIKGFSLTMPTPPIPPALPGLSNSEIPSREAFESYVDRYAVYMGQWDTVYKQFLLHLVTRQTQSDEFKERRWTDEKTTEMYRLSLKEDQAVLQRWSNITEKHAKVVKEYVIVKGRILARDGREGLKQAESDDSPRKKAR